jgi:hypothetical protein
VHDATMRRCSAMIAEDVLKGKKDILGIEVEL